MDANELFKNGCFSPRWLEDEPVDEQMPISSVYASQNKDLETLLAELDDIKAHIQDVQQRQWSLAKMIIAHNNDFAKE